MNKKILLVDDNEDILQVLGLALQIKEFEVRTANNGRAALEVLKHEDVDLLITDIFMPEIEGMELISTVQQMDRPPKIIAISGGDGVNTGGKGSNNFLFLGFAGGLGADHVLKKPFENDELIEIVNNLLATH
jgi:CheY-like chemotaxis protein